MYMSPSCSSMYFLSVRALRTEQKWLALGMPVMLSIYWVLGENDPSPLHPRRVSRTLASFPEHRLLMAANSSVGYMTKLFGFSSLSWKTCGAILYFMRRTSYTLILCRYYTTFFGVCQGVCGGLNNSLLLFYLVGAFFVNVLWILRQMALGGCFVVLRDVAVDCWWFAGWRVFYIFIYNILCFIKVRWKLIGYGNGLLIIND